MPKMPKKDRLVFSIGPSGVGSEARSPAAPRAPATGEPPERQAPRVRRERSGRRGKTVTVAEPFRLGKAESAALLADLKKTCGGGGTVKVIQDRQGRPALSFEVQGDHVERVLALLLERGYRAR